MIIGFTEEFSTDIGYKFDFSASYDKELELFFHDKFYGEDLKTLYIGLFCVGPDFEGFFKPRKPSYQSVSKIYIEHGIQVEYTGKSLAYELRLNFQEYLKSAEIKPLLARDVLNSLSVIGTVKKIKHFDLTLFRSDLEEFFKLNRWLD